MHELAVTQSILAIALDAAEGRPVSAVDLVIGEMSSIVDDSIQFYFDVLSQGTAAEGARLRFRRELAQLHCWGCGGSFAAAAPLPQACPACGDGRLQVAGGREFLVESIEVEEAEPVG